VNVSVLAHTLAYIELKIHGSSNRVATNHGGSVTFISRRWWCRKLTLTIPAVLWGTWFLQQPWF